MATMTLTQRQTDASAAIPLPIEALAGGKSTTPNILALDLRLKTGSAPALHPPALNEQRAKVAATAECGAFPTGRNMRCRSSDTFVAGYAVAVRLRESGANCVLARACMRMSTFMAKPGNGTYRFTAW